jgi:DNA-binding MarR family transcriptional regulator
MTVESAIWPGLVRLFNHVENYLSRQLYRTHGLGLSEYRALHHLSHAPHGELRMQELADTLGLNQSSVTRLVGRLEHAGLTTREECPNDKRGVFTMLTKLGMQRYREAHRSYERVLTEAFDDAALKCDTPDLVEALRQIGRKHLDDGGTDGDAAPDGGPVADAAGGAQETAAARVATSS